MRPQQIFDAHASKTGAQMDGISHPEGASDQNQRGDRVYRPSPRHERKQVELGQVRPFLPEDHKPGEAKRNEVSPLDASR